MSEECSYANKKLFTIGLIVLQLIIIPIYAIFVRFQPHNDELSIGYSYPSYIDLILLTVVGAGFFNTFIRTYSYMGLASTFLFFCVSMQIYFLFAAFWTRILVGKEMFDRNNTVGAQWTIYIREQDFTLAVYSANVMNMVFGIMFGRIGFFQKLVIVIVEMIAYTLNSVILVDLLKIYDVGGSIFSHTFGAYFGMGLSFIVSRVRRPITKIQHSNETVIFSFIGCFIIFCYVPSINSQYLTQTPFQKSTVIMNSILAMCCSVAVAFALSILIKGKFSVIDLFNGSLCGAIGAGSSAGLFVNPCACMILGSISAVVAIFGMEYLSGWLEKNWKIFDTFGVHNVRGLPGIIGGLGGAIGIALSYTIPEDAFAQLNYLSKHEGRTINQMVGFQVLGTFSTVILSFLTGMFTGWIITKFYNIEEKNFYLDNIYFQLPQDSIQMFHKKGAHIKKKQSFMDSKFLQFNQSGITVDEGSLQTFSLAESSRIASPVKLRKLPSLPKKQTPQEKIEEFVQKLDNPPVKQVQDEYSQCQDEVKVNQFQQVANKEESQMKINMEIKMAREQSNVEGLQLQESSIIKVRNPQSSQLILVDQSLQHSRKKLM